ncbi:phosphotransferase [Puerhibacterium puerhi]|uniref:phosphotransferase n=1 Tax=Puerhibacterium puerhi TaxID=2692623 RepID=UPI001915DF7C|nr:phosphotransferase [Puerhibacterium puerhi]
MTTPQPTAAEPTATNPAAAEPFSVTVATPGWRAAAEAWVRDAVGRRDARVTGVEQPRVRPWSTQLVVDTTAGRFWFKACCPAQAFEPALQALLADLVPGAADAPVAVDADRGWLLTADRGATLREDHEPTPDDWAAVLTAWVAVQQALAAHRDAVLAVGVPDCSPATVPARFDLMLARLRALPAAHPSHPDPDAAARLEAARPRVAAAAGLLAADPLPASLQHGDLHPGNVFATPGGLRVFDLGDAQWAHPLEALVVPRAVIGASGLDPAPALAAARAAWGAADDAGWDALLRAAGVTHAVNRSLTWWDCLVGATDAEVADWGEAPLRHLSRVLEDV